MRDTGRGLRAEQWARYCGRYLCADVIEKYARNKLLSKTASYGNWGGEPELGEYQWNGIYSVEFPLLTVVAAYRFALRERKASAAGHSLAERHQPELQEQQYQVQIEEGLSSHQPDQLEQQF